MQVDLMKSARGGTHPIPRGLCPGRRALARAIRGRAGASSHPLGLRLATGTRETRPRFLLGQLVHYFALRFALRLGLGTWEESCASWIGVCASSPDKRASRPWRFTSSMMNRTARLGFLLPRLHALATPEDRPIALAMSWSPSPYGACMVRGTVALSKGEAH